MTLPVALIPPELAIHLRSLENRIALLENPEAPGKVFESTTANMPAASEHPGCVLRNTTLNILAVSDGVNWIRQDTGGVI